MVDHRVVFLESFGKPVGLCLLPCLHHGVAAVALYQQETGVTQLRVEMSDLADPLVDGNGTGATAHRLDIDIGELLHLTEPFEDHCLFRLHTNGVDVTG